MDQTPKQQIYLGDDDFIARMQKHAGLDAKNPNKETPRRKANISKIQSSAPALFSNINRFAGIKHHTKQEQSQNIANAFYQGGHSQTAIALAFDISSSTLSRVIKGYENGGWMA